MGYDAFDTAVFSDVAGLKTWAGQDFTIHAHSALGKLYVRGKRWMGDSYDVLFDPGHPTQIWRNGRKLKSLAPNQVWRVIRNGDNVSFQERP